jgi:hypothetical protein
MSYFTFTCSVSPPSSSAAAAAAVVVITVSIGTILTPNFASENVPYKILSY